MDTCLWNAGERGVFGDLKRIQLQTIKHVQKCRVLSRFPHVWRFLEGLEVQFPIGVAMAATAIAASSAQQFLWPHGVTFPGNSVGCCQVPVNFP
jgi:hypothetical protein